MGCMYACIVPVMSAFSAVVFRLPRHYGEDVWSRRASQRSMVDTSPDCRGAEPEPSQGRVEGWVVGQGGTLGSENDTQNKVIVVVILLSNLLEKNCNLGVVNWTNWHSIKIKGSEKNTCTACT